MKFQSASQQNPSQNVISSVAPRMLSGKRILIVDDNDINRKLIQWLVEKQGGEFDSVENGEQATDACMQVNYDLVLMDVSMPVMDGLEASSKIRAFEQSRKNQKARLTPIIALTANFLDSDRECFRNAGMDDFVAKPLDQEVLIQVMKKWCDQDHVDYTRLEPHSGKLPGTSSIGIALPALDPDMGIKLSSGDFDNWRLLLNMLLEQLPKYSLGLTLAAKNRAQLISISHKLAGASSCCGAPALSHAAQQLEEYCRLGEDCDQVDSLRNDLQHQICRLQDATSNYA